MTLGVARPSLPLVVTAGSRESIGTEILSKAWRFWAQRCQKKHQANDEIAGGLRFLSIGGDKKAFEAFSVPCRVVSEIEEANAIFPHALPLLQPKNVAKNGQGQEARASLDAALRLCLEGKACGIVTLPVEKRVFSEQPREQVHDATKGDATLPCLLWGHTEYIAAKLGIEEYGMLLAWRSLRTLPITRHVSLRQALAMLDEGRVIAAARVVHKALREDFNIKHPRLAIAGLNPHAGEGGLCGDEEETILRPAIASLRAEGIAATGPYSPDSLFLASTRKTFDCALTLYHDQGLIPLKLLSNQRAVNITIGLPLVRCSPDHGTARDIVGRGIADPSSLIAALAMAWRIARTRKARTRLTRTRQKASS